MQCGCAGVGDDRVPQGALGDVVRGLDAFLGDEGEERLLALEDVADGPLHRPHPALEVCPRRVPSRTLCHHRNIFFEFRSKFRPMPRVSPPRFTES